MSLEAFSHKTFRELYFFSVTILNQQKGEMLLEGEKNSPLWPFHQLLIIGLVFSNRFDGWAAKFKHRLFFTCNATPIKWSNSTTQEFEIMKWHALTLHVTSSLSTLNNYSRPHMLDCLRVVVLCPQSRFAGSEKLKWHARKQFFSRSKLKVRIRITFKKSDSNSYEKN